MLSPTEIGGVRPQDLAALPPVKTTPVADLPSIVAAARAAQPAWEALGFEARAKILKKACHAALARAEESAKLIEDEAGKLRPFALLTEAIGPVDYLKSWISVARPYLKSRKLPINPIAMPGKKGRVDIIARGVVGIIAPWNYPLAAYFKPMMPALLSGNAVIMKPSEYAPRTGAWFAAVLSEHLPKGIVQCVQGAADVGSALIDSGIDSLVFTGSVKSGKAVVKHAAERMIPCSIELGGKDAALVLEDCDFDRTVAGVLGVGFLTCGQDCGAIERVYVPNAIADRFVDALGKAAAAIRVPMPGDDLSVAELSPLSTPAQLQLVETHVGEAVAKGAKLVCGGKRTGVGLWYQPTVLDRCDHTMAVVNDETFGPVIAIVRVKDVDEAVKLANDSRYGLNASIWTKDVAKAKALAPRFEAGTIFINNHGFTGAIPSAPWTGVKDTGYGVANSEFSLHSFTRPRTVVIDSNKGPDFWWAPADKVLTDIGERLLAAQLGKVLGALKIPGLMKKRQKRILDGARGAGK
ncbi:MAG: aldehyde dehydrogenase family protein [Deltaproteobacteria bacterium]|nr:aldehyde dehydrogenase family protein [Deltaproteobacteria bacterium]